MSRPKMLPGTRPTKEMLSTRIPSHLYDRTRAFAISSRFTIEEITTAALEAYLDSQAPETKARYQPAPATATTGAADARIDALESKLDRLLSALAPEKPVAPAARRAR